MAAHVSFVEAAKVLAAGASFLPLAWGLGFALARWRVTARDSSGRLRAGSLALIALCFAVLVGAHALALLWLDVFHPAVTSFYAAGAAIAPILTRAKPATPGQRPR